VVLFVVALALTMIAASLLTLMPALWKLAAGIFAAVPIALTIGALVSCLTSGKPANITLLWVIIILIAPILGSLLWFAWGRRNT
jgi:Phospholipase_D-nuclease N-terminal